MTTLTVRKVGQDLKQRLRMRAARRGRSMEAEARCIRRVALEAPDERAHLVAALDAPPPSPLPVAPGADKRPKS